MSSAQIHSRAARLRQGKTFSSTDIFNAHSLDFCHCCQGSVIQKYPVSLELLRIRKTQVIRRSSLSNHWFCCCKYCGRVTESLRPLSNENSWSESFLDYVVWAAIHSYTRIFSEFRVEIWWDYDRSRTEESRNSRLFDRYTWEFTVLTELGR